MAQANEPERLTYSVRDAAAALGVSKEAVWDRVWDGTIPSFRIGRRVLIPRRALEALLDSAETPARSNG